MKNHFLIVLLIIVLIFTLALKRYSFSGNNPPQPIPTTTEILETKTMKIGDFVLNVEIADSNEERVRGLSGREKLEEGNGLLFVFEEEREVGIWMKDMNFPIDIAWLDKNKKIIHIEHNVSPETYPKIFTSPTHSLYVLETNAGFFQKFDIRVGNTAQLPK